MYKKFFILTAFLFVFAFSVRVSAGDNDTLTIEASSIGDADESVKDYLSDHFPLLTDSFLDGIISKRIIEITEKKNSGEESFYFKVKYPVKKCLTADTMKILWELNIPEFRSHIFHICDKDTVYLDTWNNVVGTIKDKTFTGNFQAFRIRNWPSWKDPEKGKEHLPATPPGPNNPLGLFVVHYDERSLRYFHGTNKPNLVYSKFRSLSHGCVRNDNDNIEKMKEFIIKRVVKSKDLSFWLDSKKSMTYDFEEVDKFPVRIIYKTFMVGKDSKGSFVELYKDIYNYSNPRNINTSWNDESLITTTSPETLAEEIKVKLNPPLSTDKLLEAARRIIKQCDFYERYYIDDLLRD